MGLRYLCTKVTRSAAIAASSNSDLNWITTNVPKKMNGEQRAWQQLSISHIAEIRKLISALSDIEFKLHHVESVQKTLTIILDEIGNESQELQHRILDRLKKSAINIAVPD
jgi:hypothetical protein